MKSNQICVVFFFFLRNEYYNLAVYRLYPWLEFVYTSGIYKKNNNKKLFTNNFLETKWSIRVSAKVRKRC
jgi:hypothetical protein